jgi:butyryl-CoA dehydrogenase
MDFAFNDEQELLLNLFKEFTEKEVAPIAAALDEEERFPQELLPKMAEIGLMGIPVPEEFGGVGMGELEYALAVEEISKACASTGVTLCVHTSLACGPILAFGNDGQKAKYLPELASGQQLGAFALTEPGAGSDAAAIKTTAEDKGDHYLLNGSKVFTTNGKYAGVYIVFAVTARGAGSKGISAFIVEKDAPGFSFGSKEKKMGLRASATYELIFDGVKVPKENLLGQENHGFQVAMTALDSCRIGIGAQAVGIAQGAIDAAAQYVKDRSQFGRSIASFQNTQFTLSDLQTRTDAARMLVYRAAWAKDQGKPYGPEAAMAKLFASETACEVTRKAVQLHGGYGYTRDYPVERMMRDAKCTEIYGGASEIQKLVISRGRGLA